MTIYQDYEVMVPPVLIRKRRSCRKHRNSQPLARRFIKQLGRLDIVREETELDAISQYLDRMTKFARLDRHRVRYVVKPV